MPPAPNPLPLILVSASTRADDGVERVRLNLSYVNALTRAGLVPLVTPPLEEVSAVNRALDAAQGLVLTGGEDVDPARFGEAPHPRTNPPHPRRDAWEIALARAAQARRLPVLAICRGIQVMNVALGGTLVQDIPACCPGALAHDGAASRSTRVHAVEIDDGTRMAEALGTTRLAANSIHHQAVARVAEPLRVVARAPDGVVEGVEARDPGWWMLGVQWHPEELVEAPGDWDRRLFAAFAAACLGRPRPSAA